VPYKIFVTTSKKFGSGTDSKVYIKLYGEEGSSDKIPLAKSLNYKNPFESGHEDEFEIIAPDLGPLKTIK
jgi:hypothetical protein